MLLCSVYIFSFDRRYKSLFCVPLWTARPILRNVLCADFV